MRDTKAKRPQAAKREPNRERHEAFEQLLIKYEKLMWHIARRYFPNDEDAMDACQEAALKIYNGLPRVSIREDGSLKSWVCAVTANACLDELRKRKSTAIPLPADDIAGVSAAAAPSAEEEAGARERAGEILQAVAQLPGDQRILVILRDMNGLSYQELSEAVGVNINTVKSRLSRARAALKKLIGP